MHAQLLKADQVVDGEKIIDIGQGRLHTKGQRLITGAPQQGVEPDQPVAGVLETVDLVLQEVGIASIPTITNQQHHRATAQNTPPPHVVKVLDRLADTRTTAPVDDLTTHRVEGVVQVTVAQLTGNPGEARTEDEALHTPQATT